MSMESIKKVVADNPGILQCELEKHMDCRPSGTQVLKLVKRGEIVRVVATKKHTRNTYRLYPLVK